MNRVVFGICAGLAFGIVDVLLMIPIDLPDKKTAMLGAFLNRFAIGFLIPVADVGTPIVLRGAIIGLLVSLPDAVITKAYAPILIVGMIGGALVGWAAGKWAV